MGCISGFGAGARSFNEHIFVCGLVQASQKASGFHFVLVGWAFSDVLVPGADYFDQSRPDDDDNRFQLLFCRNFSGNFSCACYDLLGRSWRSEYQIKPDVKSSFFSLVAVGGGIFCISFYYLSRSNKHSYSSCCRQPRFLSFTADTYYHRAREAGYANG